MIKKTNPNLTAEQKLVLFEEGTEMAGTSDLNHEKREGSFYCANCGCYTDTTTKLVNLAKECQPPKKMGLQNLSSFNKGKLPNSVKSLPSDLVSTSKTSSSSTTPKG